VGLKEARRLVEGATPGSAFGKSVKEREGWVLEMYEQIVASRPSAP